jgi:hypothetical protein
MPEKLTDFLIAVLRHIIRGGALLPSPRWMTPRLRMERWAWRHQHALIFDELDSGWNVWHGTTNTSNATTDPPLASAPHASKGAREALGSFPLSVSLSADGTLKQ